MRPLPVAQSRSGVYKPSVSILPTLDAGLICAGSRSDVPSVLDVGLPVHVVRGSTAIFLILQRIGLQPGDEVLIPAFHCPSMVQPVVAARGRPAFYPIAPDLGIAVEHIEPHLRPQTRAVLVPHLFGRMQHLEEIRALCDLHRLTLIEDCAHALFGTCGGRPVGSTGHFAIASQRKFLPLEEGGLLTSAVDHLRDLQVRGPSPGRAIRLAFDGVDTAVTHNRLRALRPLVKIVKGIRHLRRDTSRDYAPSSDAEGIKDPQMSDPVRASALTQRLVRRFMTQELVRRRRENFVVLAAALNNLPLLRPLELKVGADFVPYMLPVLLERPEQQFDWLRASGMPMWRWEHSQSGACQVTDHYARAMIQIPCHQSLQSAEIAWMIDVLRKTGGSTT